MLRYFVGQVDSTWDNPNNWVTNVADGTGNGIPQSGDDVDFSQGPLCTAGPFAPVTIENFSDPTGQFVADPTGQSVIIVSNQTLTVEGTLQVAQDTDINGFVLNNCVISDTADGIAGTLTLTNCVIVGTPAVVLVSGGTLIDGGGNLDFDNIRQLGSSSSSGGTTGAADTFFNAVYGGAGSDGGSLETEFVNFFNQNPAGIFSYLQSIANGVNVLGWGGNGVTNDPNGLPVVSPANMSHADLGGFNIQSIADTTHLVGAPANTSALNGTTPPLTQCGLRVFPAPNSAGSGIVVTAITAYDPEAETMTLASPLTTDMVNNPFHYQAVLLAPDQFAAYKLSGRMLDKYTYDPASKVLTLINDDGSTLGTVTLTLDSGNVITARE